MTLQSYIDRAFPITGWPEWPNPSADIIFTIGAPDFGQGGLWKAYFDAGKDRTTAQWMAQIGEHEARCIARNHVREWLLEQLKGFSAGETYYNGGCGEFSASWFPEENLQQSAYGDTYDEVLIAAVEAVQAQKQKGEGHNGSEEREEGSQAASEADPAT